MRVVEQHDRLKALLVASVEEGFSGKDREELNALLREHAEARRFAAHFLRVDAALADLLHVEKSARDYAPEKVPRGAAQGARFSRSRKTWMAVAALATVAAVVMMSLWLGGPNAEPVATVRSAQRVTGLQSGDVLNAGEWVRFEKGWVAIKFESGAKLAVEGPAEFQMISGNGARMTRGMATIRVPGRIKGFTLETPSERVVDLGTAFGVEVEESGATSVAVFEGEIELQGAIHQAAPQRLGAGTSVRVDDERHKPQAIPYNVANYQETWQASFGVEAVEGDVRVAKPGERSIPGEVVDSEHLLLFPERENVSLPAGFSMSVSEPGTFSNETKPRAVRLESPLSTARTVDSFLLQFNPDPEMANTATRHFSGTLRFERPIVGLLLNRERLDASDIRLGLPGGDFMGVFRRGINADDKVTLLPDRRTLSVSFHIENGVDQIRVLLASDPD